MIYCIELFSGNADISKALNIPGVCCCKSVDYCAAFKPDICIDVFDIRDLEHLRLLCGFPRIDFIWASPDCTSYSIASHGIHRVKGGLPVSDYAFLSDKLNWHLWKDILINCPLFIVENPRGHYRNMPFVNAFRTTIYFGSYGGQSPKPTDLFSNCFGFSTWFNTSKPKPIGVTRGSMLGLGGVSGFLNRCKMPQGFINDLVNFVKSQYLGV